MAKESLYLADNPDILLHLTFTSEQHVRRNGGNPNAGTIPVVFSHGVATFDNSAAGVTNIYKNLVLSGAADETSGTPAVPTEKTIVGNSNAGGNTIDGLLGEVRVFKGILTANQRDQIYQQDRHLYNV